MARAARKSLGVCQASKFLSLDEGRGDFNTKRKAAQIQSNLSSPQTKFARQHTPQASARGQKGTTLSMPLVSPQIASPQKKFARNYTPQASARGQKSTKLSMPLMKGHRKLQKKEFQKLTSTELLQQDISSKKKRTGLIPFQCSWIPEENDNSSERTLDEYSYEELKNFFCFAWLKPFVVDKSAAYYDELQKRSCVARGSSDMSDDACDKQQRAIRNMCLYIKDIQRKIAERLTYAQVDAKGCMEDACALLFAVGDIDQWHEDCEDHVLCLDIVKTFDTQMSSLLSMENIGIDTETRAALQVRLQSLQERWSHLQEI